MILEPKTVPTSTNIRRVALESSPKSRTFQNCWSILRRHLNHFYYDFHGGMVIHAGHRHWAFLEFCELHLLLLRALILWHDYLSGLFFVGLRFKRMLLMTSIKLQHCIGRLERPLVSNNNSCIYLAKLGLPWPLGRQSDIPYNFDDTSYHISTVL